MINIQKVKALFLLVMATGVWAASFPAYKVLLTKMTPIGVLCWRYIVGSILVSLFWFPSLTKGFNRVVWVRGLGLGVILWMGYTLQAYGLGRTTASRAAFFTSLLILFGPLFYRLSHMRHVRPGLWKWWALALVGLAFFTFDDWGWSWNIGDFYNTMGAAVFGMQMVLVDRWATRENASHLNLVQMVWIALASMIWSSSTDGRFLSIKALTGQDWIILVGLALLPSWLAYEWQFRAQPVLQTPLASLVYATEPLMASILSYFWIGEGLRSVQWLGAAFIVFALIGGGSSPIFSDDTAEVA